MKKNIVIIGLICTLFLIIIIYAMYILNNNNHIEILIGNTRNCGEKEKYFNENKKDIYIDCFDDILIKKNGKTYNLKKSLSEKIINLEEILKLANSKIEYWDGGSIIYKYNNFSIINYQRNLETDKKCDYMVITSKDASIDTYCK